MATRLAACYIKPSYLAGYVHLNSLRNNHYIIGIYIKEALGGIIVSTGTQEACVGFTKQVVTQEKHDRPTLSTKREHND